MNRLAVSVSLVPLLLAGCQKPDPSFDLKADEQSFLVSPEVTEVPQKIDILWVIDNSGSMATSQAQLAASFPAFIQNFSARKYDFQMGITTTDAYRGRFNALEVWKKDLRPSVDSELFLTPDTLDLHDKFVQMAQVGINGNGDERAFQSLEDTLNNPNNLGFLREDAYLAVIILSDEDDFSNPTTAFLDPQYNHASIIPVSYYFDFLTNLAGEDNFGVYSISILDETCRNQLNDTFTERKIAHRYHQLVSLSGGVNASLCEDFGGSLSFIADTIVQKRPPQTTYTLLREPVESTIQIFVNDILVEQDPAHGWVYDATNFTITLNGNAAAAIQNGGAIRIIYDPKNPFEQ